MFSFNSADLPFAAASRSLSFASRSSAFRRAVSAAVTVDDDTTLFVLSTFFNKLDNEELSCLAFFSEEPSFLAFFAVVGAASSIGRLVDAFVETLLFVLYDDKKGEKMRISYGSNERKKAIQYGRIVFSHSSRPSQKHSNILSPVGFCS